MTSLSSLNEIPFYFPQLALTFSRLSQLAYLKFEEDRSFLESELKVLELSLVDIYFSREIGTQAYLAIHKEYAVLVFRGTEKDFLDIVTDLRFRLELSDLGGVHRGFFAALSSVSDEIEAGIKKVQHLPLYVTGHSLGGALAKASVLSIQASWQGCYTYGSPPICDFKRAENIQVPVYRFINAADVVPRAMSLGGFPVFLIRLILILIRKIFQWVGIRETWIFARIQILDLVAPDLNKYEHFGTPIYFEEAGMVVDGKEAPSLFWSIVARNWKRGFLDHSIANYIGKLELQETLRGKK
ncbi:lipase family protein [bacterium]|nr:lipase family protein [bacterium]